MCTVKLLGWWASRASVTLNRSTPYVSWGIWWTRAMWAAETSMNAAVLNWTNWWTSVCKSCRSHLTILEIYQKLFRCSVGFLFWKILSYDLSNCFTNCPTKLSEFLRLLHYSKKGLREWLYCDKSIWSVVKIAPEYLLTNFLSFYLVITEVSWLWFGRSTW